MKKKLTLWIFFFPIVVMSQTTYKNGVISFDFGHKKQQTQDSVQQNGSNSDSLKQASRPKAPKQSKPAEEEGPYDWRKEGIFKALFHAGINACQIDGDGFSGYNYPGFEGGIGAMMRFHRNFSASMEINFTMKGAKQNFDSATAANQQYNYLTLQKYMVRLNYIEIPLAINVYDKKQVIMGTAGLSIAALVGYYEQNQDAQNITTAPNGELSPHKYDFCGFLGLHFIIAKHYAIGGQFSYSLVRIRGPEYPGLTRLLGEYNNDLTVEFMYIMDTVKKKKKG